MTRQVWKYELPFVLNEISMPVGAEILTAKAQRDVMCLWALVDPNAPKVNRRFETVGTGHQLVDGPVTYVGTLMTADDYLVFHIFERH